MENIDFNSIIQMVLAAVLPVLAGFIAAYVKQWLVVKQKELELKIGDQRSWMIREAIRIAINAAEQSGLAGLIEKEGAAKKAYAIESARRQLRALGIDINVLEIVDLIEAAVFEEFNKKNEPDATVKISGTPGNLT